MSGVTGIIGAMDEEVALLREKMTVEEVIRRASMEFYKGKLCGRDAVVVMSGIGKVNAGICAQILVDLFGVTEIINTGVAGSLKNEINIGDIVLSTDALQHDMDARSFGYERGQIPRMEVLSFPADERLIGLAKRACGEVNPDIGVFTGRIASGDVFVADKAVKDDISSWTDGFCTEMEGAAIAQAAWLNGVPFVIVRAISDKADDSASMDYPTFEKQAILHSVRLIERFVELLGKDADSESEPEPRG